jgi:hypothetical protein
MIPFGVDIIENSATPCDSHLLVLTVGAFSKETQLSDDQVTVTLIL